MLRLSAVFGLILTGVVLVSAGCGGSGKNEGEGATPQQAVQEIGEIRELLASAVAQVEAGKREQAEETVGNAYLEHFEKVEAPLGERDHDLMEELEEAISTELRNEIKSGKPAGEISAKVDAIDADLDRAVAVLER